MSHLRLCLLTVVATLLLPSCDALTPQAPSPGACGDDAAPDVPCGLNGRGAIALTCGDEGWSAPAGCEDPDVCVDGQRRDTATPCEAGGVAIERCDQGAWVDAGECGAASACEGGERVGPTSCGVNARGSYLQECADGAWLDTDLCVDPDVCVDGARRPGVTPCQGGLLEQECEQGRWGDTGACAAPAACEDGAAVTVPDACGLNGRGDLEAVCTEQGWSRGECADPDVCVDGAQREAEGASCEASPRAHAPLERCEQGAWGAPVCRVNATYRVSVTCPGAQAPRHSELLAVNEDGRFVVYGNAGYGARDRWPGGLYLWDGATGRVTTILDEHNDGSSHGAAVSERGDLVVFTSDRDDLVPGDTNGARDVFAYDAVTSTLTLVSVGMGGRSAAGASDGPSMSADGRHVVFTSAADDLVPGDTNARADVFMRDLQAGTTQRLSVLPNGRDLDGGCEQATISRDASAVVFVTDAANITRSDDNGAPDVYHLDLASGALTPVTVDAFGATATNTGFGNWDLSPTPSADGRHVAFESNSPGIVTPDTNGASDVFVRDMLTGVTTRVSSTASGMTGDDHSFDASISSSGRFVAFESSATDLVPGDTNGARDVFVRDMVTGALTRVVTPSGAQGESSGGPADTYGPLISGDGAHVVFVTAADNFLDPDTNSRVDVLRQPRQGGQVDLVSAGVRGAPLNDSSGARAISADGRHVAFASLADNMFVGDTNGASDVFVHDTSTSVTLHVSVNDAGEPGDAGSLGPTVSADGRLVAFTSNATNLAPDDTNGVGDVFVRDTRLGTTRRVSVSSAGAQASAGSFNPAISPDGRHVTFLSYADDLVPGDTNGGVDAFVHDLDTGTTVRVNEGPAEPQGLSNLFLVEAAPSRSARTIAFVSPTAFVPEDTNAGADVYVRDMTTGEVELVSVAVDGMAGGGVAYAPGITPDGRFVAFTSASPSMVPGDTNAQPDVFVRDLLLETTRRVSVTTEGFERAEAATIPSISADGRFVSFRSLGSVWVRDLVAQRTLSLSVDVSNQPTLSDVYTRAPISADGRYVAFGAVNADDWDMDSTNGAFYNVFITPVPR